MRMFWHEFKSNLKSLLVWWVIIVLLLAEAMTEFSVYVNNPDLNAMLEQMPPALLEAFSMRAFNLTTLTGFYGIMFLYFALVVTIAAAMWGSHGLAREERSKTAEFTLTLPVARFQVLTAKVMAALADLLLLLAWLWGLAWVFVQKYEPQPAFYDFLRLEMEALLVLGVFFLALGVLLSSWLPRARRAVATTVALVMVMYFLAIAAGMHKKLDFLRYVTPFKYFDAARFLHAGRLDEQSLLLSFALTAGMLALAYWRYQKRDVYT